MNNYKIYSIIVTYNGRKWIEKCIKSVYSDSSVIVVDNGSTDGTIEFIDNHFSDVILLKQETNLGFGRANNIGINYALKHAADAVFLLNQDAWANKHVINKLIEFAELNKSYGILSPLHFNGNGQELDKSFQLLASNELISDLATRNFRNFIYNVPFINAAAWLIPRHVIENVGGFDPGFFMYGEDVNYTQRVTFHGYGIGIIPSLSIYHDSGNNYYDKNNLNPQEKISRATTNYMVKYGDVNKRSKWAHYRFILYLFKKSIIRILALDLVNAKFYALLLLRVWGIDVNNEKNKCRKVGSHYLDCSLLLLCAI